MKQILYYASVVFLVAISALIACNNGTQNMQMQEGQAMSSLDPYAANNGIYPPDSVYKGPPVFITGTPKIQN